MIFDWVVLTSSDRHILSVTESRLQSHSFSLIAQSCEFLRDVLLQDFPVEIFIQRPNVVKTLLQLLDLYGDKEEALTSAVIGCLSELTQKLLQCLLQQRNKDLKQTTKSK